MNKKVKHENLKILFIFTYYHLRNWIFIPVLELNAWCLETIVKAEEDLGYKAFKWMTEIDNYNNIRMLPKFIGESGNYEDLQLYCKMV